MRFYIEQCLHSLFRAVDGIETEVYIVDNHSDDGSVEYLTQKFPDVNIISSNRNLGFSRANNIAIKQCTGEYVLLLNPDTIVGENTIRDVLQFMDAHEKAGAAGVMMLKDNGEKAMESRRGVPTPMTAFYKMSGLCARYPESHRFARYYMSYLSWNEPAKIEIISGAFCMLRHEALDRVGQLDEDFFMYGEDIDLSFRLIKGGYENWYIPAKILHYKGESTHRSSFRYVHVFYDAMLIFIRKHYGHFSIFVSLPLKIAICFKALLAFIGMQMHSARKVLEHHGDIPVLGLHIVHALAVDEQIALGDILQAGHHPQRGGLAAAGRTHQNDELLVRDLQIEVVDGGYLVVVDLLDTLQRNSCHMYDRKSSASARAPSR